MTVTCKTCAHANFRIGQKGMGRCDYKGNRIPAAHRNGQVFAIFHWTGNGCQVHPLYKPAYRRTAEEIFGKPTQP